MSEPLPDVPVSPLAQELVESGAKPVGVDVNELLAQITALQGRVTAMEAEKGVPSDPTGAALKNLKDHVAAHAAANPLLDFSELATALATLNCCAFWSRTLSLSIRLSPIWASW